MERYYGTQKITMDSYIIVDDAKPAPSIDELENVITSFFDDHSDGALGFNIEEIKVTEDYTLHAVVTLDFSGRHGDATEIDSAWDDDNSLTNDEIDIIGMQLESLLIKKCGIIELQMICSSTLTYRNAA